MLTRRSFLKLFLNFILFHKVLLNSQIPVFSQEKGCWVNDVHSKLNRTQVKNIVSPSSIDGIRSIIKTARAEQSIISTAGGRHAMGGQQFATNAHLIDTSRLNKILDFDKVKGTITVESGIMWPQLVNYLIEEQNGESFQWSIIQKPTGTDNISLGGSLSANVHGRGLNLKPFINDIECFTLINGNGDIKTCSRRENQELFQLAIGGYGLFGLIYSIKLRLMQRVKLKRHVELADLQDLVKMLEEKVQEGYTYGDFQFAIDSSSEDFLKSGIFSVYKPVDLDTPMPDSQMFLTKEKWNRLALLAHTNKKEAFELYSKHYLATHNNVYWSDEAQLGPYIYDYHDFINNKIHPGINGSEIITEIYIPKECLCSFMETVRRYFREQNIDLIYGTIRLIQEDKESFLAWAKKSFVCIIFNLHTKHTDEGIALSKKAFRYLINQAIQFDGSYYLTYHKFATKEQVDHCYPQFREFLALKKKYDPDEIFQSNWYTHYKEMYSA